MKALVTGSAGFIGSHLCEKLVEEGHDVLGLDRKDGYDLLRVELDLTDVDVVFHLAGQPGVRQSWSDFDKYLNDNLLATQRLLEAAKGADLERFVYASSSSVYGSGNGPISPYGVTKLAVENLCSAYATAFGIPTVGLRYFTVYGPRQRPDMAFARFIEATLKKQTIEVYGDGEQTRRFTYVADAVEATLAARPGIHDVAGQGEASINEVIEMIGELLEPPRVDYKPAALGDPRHSHVPDLFCMRPTPLREGLSAQVDEACRSVS